MKPTEPGRYLAREIVYDMLGQRIPTLSDEIEVVEGVKNPRGHRLLVKTGLSQPKYKSLDCFEFLDKPILGFQGIAILSEEAFAQVEQYMMQSGEPTPANKRGARLLRKLYGK